MKAKILFSIAFLTHPIFLPLFINLPGWELMRMISAVGLALVLPAAYFSLKGIDLVSPTLKQRRVIYYWLAVAYAILFTWSWADPDLPTSFGFVHWSIGLILLGFLVNQTKWNISWHAMGWGMSMIFIKEELDVLLYVWGVQNLGAWEISLAFSIVIGLLVMLVRYWQNAHSVKELALGYVLGLTVSIFVPTLFQWTSIA